MSDPRLPAFLILGVRRGGTTSLYDYLTQHPKIAKAKRKELHFFDREYWRGIDWYKSRFPWWLRFRKQMLTGEATPYYLFHPAVPDRVKATVPDAKLIVLLRNPIDRAFSHYQTAIRRGYDDLTFEQAIDAEPGRLAGEEDKLVDPTYSSDVHTNLSYVSRGYYIDQLNAWHDRFGAERFLIIRSEDMYTDSAPVVAQAFRHVGVEPVTLPSYPHRNNSRHGQKMDPATRERLCEHYRPYNERLYELLGRDMDWN